MEKDCRLSTISIKTYMDLNDVQRLTLDCLISKEQKQKLSETLTRTTRIKKEDKKFYRRRIVSLTKDLLLNSNESYNNRLLPDVKNAYEAYVRACIGYFKVIDETDILQEQYKDFEEVTISGEMDEADLVSAEEANRLMMRCIKVNKCTLDNFVMRVAKEPETETPRPQQRVINLQDPQLKSKGLRKNKNMDNKLRENVKIYSLNKVKILKINLK